MVQWFLFSVLLIVQFINSSTAFALSNSTREESPDFSAVVFLQATDKDSSGEEATAFCNGTLLSANVLITAAHCIKGNLFASDRGVTVEVGNYKYATRPNGERVRVGYAAYLRHQTTYQVYFTPSFAVQVKNRGVRASPGPADDIAVIVLEKAIALPTDFVFAKIAPQNFVTALGGKEIQYLPTVVSINPFEESSLDTKRSARLNNLEKTWSGYWESKSVTRVQPGDSGSPLFMRFGNSWNIVGITKGRAETIFSNWDVFGILDKKICELAKASPAHVQSLICY